MKCNFKVKNKGTIIVTPEWVTNGHWAIKRTNPLVKDFRYLEVGRYYDGKKSTEAIPDMRTIIPDITMQYQDIDIESATSKLNAYRDFFTALSVVFEFGENKEKIGVSSEYVALLLIGQAKAKDSKSPIVIMHEDEILAVLMPMRV